MQTKRSTITRRSLLCLLASTGLSLLATEVAAADTEEDLAAAEAALAEAEAALDTIATEYEALSEQQSLTLDELDQVRKKIERLTKRIARLEARLAEKQQELATSVSEEYKDGNHGVVDLILGAHTLEDLLSNLYYYDKIIEEKTRLIQDVKDAKEELALEQDRLEEQQENLEEVSRVQAEQLEAMRQKQYEAQELIESLDEEVRELIAKREAEILAAQLEAERARKEREEAERRAAEEAAAAAAAAAREEAAREAAAREAAAAAAARGSSEEAPVSFDEEGEVTENVEAIEPPTPTTGSASAVIAACMSTPSPGAGLCAAWCSYVMANAGYGYVSGNANDMYSAWCHSSSRGDLMPGMAVAVSTHPHTTAGRIYGHVGMYVGSGTVMDNVGYIRSMSLSEWCDYYGQTVAPRWGFLKGIILS